MSGGYPQHPPGYGYGAPPAQPYTAAPYTAGAPPPPQPYGAQYAAAPYGAPSAPYSAPPGEKPPKDKHQAHGVGGAPPAHGFGGAPPAHGYGGAPPAQSFGGAPPAQGFGGAPPVHGGSYPPAGGYASPFAALVPSAFPPGTDPSVVACFQMADQDGSGFIDDNELQRALSSYNQSFSLRTVRLLMYLFTNTNTRKIGQFLYFPTSIIILN